MNTAQFQQDARNLDVRDGGAELNGCRVFIDGDSVTVITADRRHVNLQWTDLGTLGAIIALLNN